QILASSGATRRTSTGTHAQATPRRAGPEGRDIAKCQVDRLELDRGGEFPTPDPEQASSRPPERTCAASPVTGSAFRWRAISPGEPPQAVASPCARPPVPG